MSVGRRVEARQLEMFAGPVSPLLHRGLLLIPPWRQKLPNPFGADVPVPGDLPWETPSPNAESERKGPPPEGKCGDSDER